MAIIEDVPGIEIGILVAGAPAEEYPDPGPDEMPNNCFLSSVYIECLDNQEFAFSYKVDKTYDWGYRNHQLKLKFYIGADMCYHGRIEESRTRPGPVSGKVRNQVEYNEATNKWYRHKFVFTAVENVDDANKERVEEDKKIAAHLDVLKVEVSPCLVAISSPIAEKALKGKEISHGAGLDEGEPIENKPSHSSSDRHTWTHRFPEDNGPIAVYLFKYRSKEELKKERIIARSPSPSPVPVEDSEEDTKPAFKRELSEAFDLDEASVKSRRKRPKRDEDDEDLTVVDLTGYDFGVDHEFGLNYD
ncbi:hypothetical protein PG994_004085 [Apiospora phragmitis]|uniref:DUF7918 domain-containing protein n=1 Tax=Apiospora phragmitis TaxID=2905665 RepID=A0ABR1VPL8_9PEZI